MYILKCYFTINYIPNSHHPYFFLKLHQCKENEVQIKPQIVLNMKILKFIVEDFEVYINSIVRNCI